MHVYPFRTSIALGLMRAFTDRGLVVQPYKVGEKLKRLLPSETQSDNR